MKFQSLRLHLVCLTLIAATELRAQVGSFDRQPVSAVSVLGGAADFTFQFRVSQSFATLSVVVSKNGTAATSRFSMITQKVATESSAGFPTVGFFTLRISNITSADVGTYSFEVTVNGSSGSFGVSQPVTLTLGTPTVPQITAQPISTVVSLGGSTTLSVVASGVPAPTYQWKKDGVALSGAIDSSYTISFAQFDSAGKYQVVATNPSGSTISNAVDVFVGIASAPSIFFQPASVTARFGETVNFSATANGAPTPTYQWYKNGVLIQGATQQTLSITNVGLSNAGSYQVVATNLLGTATSYAATLSILPAIITQPVNLTANAGSAATFTVVADGSGPLSYRWARSVPNSLGANASGGTSSTLTIANVSSSDVGGYFVTVTNLAGSITSSVASLAVILPPSISSQPLSQTAVAGSAVTLAVVAQNTSGATYQWKRDGAAIGGATAATLVIPTVLPTDAATYSVTITNSAGSVTSNGAILRVTIPNAARLINLSILTSLSGNEVFSMGFVVGGAGTIGTKPLLVRAAGPSLAPLGVTDAHNDPTLELFAGASKVAENDNWGGLSATSNAFAQVGAFAYSSPDSRDAAVFNPSVFSGDNSVRIGGAAGASGTVLAELYDGTVQFGLTTPRLINVSVLKNIGTGLTAGFVIGGSGTLRVLVRAVGPTLTGFGVTGPLSDPRLSLFNASGTIVGGNDNWNSGDASTMAAVGAFALSISSRDAALVATLSPGNYTVQVTGANGGVGVALVEIYEVP